MDEFQKYTILKSFGLHIKHLRKQKGLTQIEVSSAMQRDQQSLQRVESGKVNPSMTYLIELSDALGISIQELFSFHE